MLDNFDFKKRHMSLKASMRSAMKSGRVVLVSDEMGAWDDYLTCRSGDDSWPAEPRI